MPSISDMPLLYSISSLKSMPDMRGSSNFRLRGGGGGRTESDRKKYFVNFLVLKLIYSRFIVLNMLIVGSTVNIKETVLFGSKGGPTFSRGGGRSQLLIPYRTCDFQGEFRPPAPPPPPTSSLGPCMTDP